MTVLDDIVKVEDFEVKFLGLSVGRFKPRNGFAGAAASVDHGKLVIVSPRAAVSDTTLHAGRTTDCWFS